MEHQIGTPAGASVNVDDDFSEESLLSALQAEVSTAIVKPPITLTVPNRPKISMEFEPNFEFSLYQAWLRKCTNKKTEETDYYRLAVLAITNSNTAILLDGKRTSMTIVDPRMHTWLGVAVGGATEAIRKLYGSDGHAIQAARQVIEYAGYSLDGDVMEADNPLDV